jgi:hypothetical protein
MAVRSSMAARYIASPASPPCLPPPSLRAAAQRGALQAKRWRPVATRRSGRDAAQSSIAARRRRCKALHSRARGRAAAPAAAAAAAAAAEATATAAAPERRLPRSPRRPRRRLATRLPRGGWRGGGCTAAERGAAAAAHKAARKAARKAAQTKAHKAAQKAVAVAAAKAEPDAEAKRVACAAAAARCCCCRGGRRGGWRAARLECGVRRRGAAGRCSRGVRRPQTLYAGALGRLAVKSGATLRRGDWLVELAPARRAGASLPSHCRRAGRLARRAGALFARTRGGLSLSLSLSSKRSSSSSSLSLAQAHVASARPAGPQAGQPIGLGWGSAGIVALWRFLRATSR